MEFEDVLENQMDLLFRRRVASAVVEVWHCQECEILVWTADFSRPGRPDVQEENSLEELLEWHFPELSLRERLVIQESLWAELMRRVRKIPKSKMS